MVKRRLNVREHGGKTKSKRKCEKNVGAGDEGLVEKREETGRHIRCTTHPDQNIVQTLCFSTPEFIFVWELCSPMHIAPFLQQ